MTNNLNEYQFENLGLAMDGGSVSIRLKNKESTELVVWLVQNVSTDYYEETSKIPGRIYLNQFLIERRSGEENNILAYFKNDILKLLSESESKSLIKKIDWIKSKDYLDFTPVKLELSAKRKKYLLNGE